MKKEKFIICRHRRSRRLWGIKATFVKPEPVLDKNEGKRARRREDLDFSHFFVRGEAQLADQGTASVTLPGCCPTRGSQLGSTTALPGLRCSINPFLSLRGPRSALRSCDIAPTGKMIFRCAD